MHIVCKINLKYFRIKIQEYNFEKVLLLNVGKYLNVTFSERVDIVAVEI